MLVLFVLREIVYVFTQFLLSEWSEHSYSSLFSLFTL